MSTRDIFDPRSSPDPTSSKQQTGLPISSLQSHNTSSNPKIPDPREGIVWTRNERDLFPVVKDLCGSNSRIDIQIFPLAIWKIQEHMNSTSHPLTQED